MSVWGVTPRLNCVWYFLGSLGIRDCELAKKPQGSVENFLRGGSSCHLVNHLVSRYPRKVACSITSHWLYRERVACRGTEASAGLKSLWSQMLKSKSVCVSMLLGESSALLRLTLHLPRLILVIDCYLAPHFCFCSLCVCAYVCMLDVTACVCGVGGENQVFHSISLHVIPLRQHLSLK